MDQPRDGFPKREGDGRVTIPTGAKITKEDEERALRLRSEDCVPAREFIKGFKSRPTGPN